MSALSDKIVRASAIVTLAHLCLKFAGLIQTKVATHYLGSTEYETIIVIAFTGVINSLFLIGEEVIGPTFLTVFVKEKEDKDERQAWRFCNSLLSLQSLILLALVSTIVCFPDFYISLFTSWTPQNNPGEYALLKTSLQFLAPSLFFLSLGSTTYVLLNGYRKFFLAAFGDASTKICIVIGLILGIGIFGWDYHALLFSIVVGSVAKVITHLCGILPRITWFRPCCDWSSPAFKRTLWLMLPLFIGIIFAKVRDNFNNVYVLSCINQKGLLMANDLGRKLYSSIQWLVPYALQIALFPFLCELVGKNERNRLGEIINSTCRMLLSVFIPLAVILAIVAKPLSILIFYGGKTGLTVASWAGLSTACYCLVLPAAAIECVLMQGAFADQRTVAVTIIGIFSSLISVLLSWLFIVHLHYEDSRAILVVALGFVLSRFLKSTLLALFMRRRIPIFPAAETLAFLGKMLLLITIAGTATYGVSFAWTHGISSGISIISPDKASINRALIAGQLITATAAGTLVTLLLAHILHITELNQMFSWAINKVKGKLKR